MPKLAGIASSVQREMTAKESTLVGLIGLRSWSKLFLKHLIINENSSTVTIAKLLLINTIT